ncbi:hypothetical protein OAT84_00545 [Gammaproteobacteria bacterium]|nr:hypothetical protein [Gammaproteobacteria bacterium]
MKIKLPRNKTFSEKATKIGGQCSSFLKMTSLGSSFTTKGYKLTPVGLCKSGFSYKTPLAFKYSGPAAICVSSLYSIVQEPFLYNTAAIEAYKEALKSASKVDKSQNNLDKEKVLELANLYLVKDEKNQFFVDYIVYENLEFNHIDDMEILWKKYKKESSIKTMLIKLYELVSTLAVTLSPLTSLLVLILSIIKIATLTLIAGFVFIAKIDFKLDNILFAKDKLMRARSVLTWSKQSFFLNFTDLFADKITEINQLYSLVLLSELVKKDNWRETLESEEEGCYIKDMFDTSPNLLHPVVKEFIQSVLDGDEINLECINKIDSDMLAEEYLDCLQNNFKSRSWMFHYAYRQLKHTFAQLQENYAIIIACSLILTPLFYIQMPVIAASIIAFFAIFIFAKPLSKKISSIFNYIKNSIINQVEYKLAPLKQRIFGVKNLDRELKKDISLLKAELLVLESKYQVHFEHRKPSAFTSPAVALSA